MQINWVYLHLLYFTNSYSSKLKTSLRPRMNNLRCAVETIDTTTTAFTNPLHYALKVTSLELSLDFFNQFGLRVLRHEEFATGCNASCNGQYQNAWSRTVIGRGPTECSAFALELIYNYGILNYERGNDLRYIAVTEDSYTGPVDKIQIATDGRKFVESPDGHWFLLCDSKPSYSSLRTYGNEFSHDKASKSSSNYSFSGLQQIRADNEIFIYVSLHVSNLTESISFYCDVLHAQAVSMSTSNHFRAAVSPVILTVNTEPHISALDYDLNNNGPRSAMLSFINSYQRAFHASQATIYYNDVGLELVQLERLPDEGSVSMVGQFVDRGEAFGRLAFATEDNAADKINERVRRYKQQREQHHVHTVDRNGDSIANANATMDTNTSAAVISKAGVVHGPMTLEPHGEEVIIVQDPDGHELCFVDGRGFENCIENGFSEVGRSIDWDYRRRLLLEVEKNDYNNTKYNTPVLQLNVKDAMALLTNGQVQSQYQSTNGLDSVIAPQDFYRHVILEVYATSCTRCVTLTPFMENMARVFKDQYRWNRGNTVAVVTINGHKAKLEGDDGLSPSELENIELILGWTKLSGYPTIFYFDSERHELVAYDGKFDEPEIAKWVVSKVASNEPQLLSQLLNYDTMDGNKSTGLSVTSKHFSESQINLLFDGECPICMMEVNFLRKRDINNKIVFTDISEKDYNPSLHGNVSVADGMTKLRAVLSDGKVITGVEVFRHVYTAIGLGWVFSITRLPVIGSIADKVYDVWAENRLRITGRADLASTLKAKARIANDLKAKVEKENCSKCEY